VNEQALKVKDLEHTSVYRLKAVGSLTLTFDIYIEAVATPSDGPSLTMVHWSIGTLIVDD